MKETFKAWMIDSKETSRDKRCVFTDLTIGDLAGQDVLVEVDYSSLNYKDMAALTGVAPILRIDKCVPGIDLAGTVVSSNDPEFKEGDKVVAIGGGLGEDRFGGMAEYARVPAELLTKLPDSLDPRRAMCLGTAGFTAAMSVKALLDHGLAPGADVLVTSVGGGVGSISSALLADMGFNLHSVTRPDRRDYALGLGAKSVIFREDFLESYKVLGNAKWDGGIDTAGGQILSTLLSQLKPNCMATCCGVTAGADFKSTVMPFILRGVMLKGINSVHVPREEREKIWQLLADHPKGIDKVNVSEINLPEVLDAAEKLREFKVLGRIVIKVKDSVQ